MQLPIGGLYTHPAPLTAPPGSFLQLANMVADATGEVRGRNGFDGQADLWGQTDGGAVNRFMPFQGRLYVHYGANKLGYFEPSGTFVNVPGIYTPVAADRRVAWTVASGVLVMSFKEGQFRVAYNGATNTYEFRRSGVPLPLDATAAASGATGWLPANSAVAYRMLFGYQDIAGRFVFGAPGQRLVFSYAAAASTAVGGLVRSGGNLVTVTTTNAHNFVSGMSITLDAAEIGPPAFGVGPFVITVTGATTFTYTEVGANGASVNAHTLTPSSANVTITQRLPGNLQAGDFLRLYRTSTTTGATQDPGDVMRVAVEHILTNVEIAAGTVSVLDETPDNLRGEFLYANPPDGFGVGIEQANYEPPAAEVMGEFQRCVLWGAPYDAQRLVLTLLGIGGSTGLQVLDPIIFVDPQANSALGSVIADTAEDIPNRRYQIYTTGTASQNIANTLRSLVRVINGNATLSAVLRAFYLSGPTDPPGIFAVERKALGSNPFAAVTQSTFTRAFSPALTRIVQVLTMARAAGVVTVQTVFAHGLTSGQTIELAAIRGVTPDPNFPVGLKTVATIIDPVTFTYLEAGANAVMVGQYDVADQPLDTAISSNGRRAGAVRISPNDIPDGAPLLNEFIVGDEDKRVLGFSSVRDGVIVHKEDGDWRIIGFTPDDFRVVPLDSSVRNGAYQTVGAFQNQGLSSTKSGVLASVETGNFLLSEPVNTNIDGGAPFFLQLWDKAPTEMEAYSFAVFDNDGTFPRAYFFLPTAAGDTYAKQALVWNGKTRTWTGPWDIPARTGIFWPATSKVYLADVTGNGVRRERKSGTNADFVDQARFIADHAVLVSRMGAIDVITPKDALNANISLANVVVGDVYVSEGSVGRVTAKDVGASTLTLKTSGTNPYVNPGTLFAGIAIVEEWLNLYGKNPSFLKTWEEVQPQFRDSAFDEGAIAFQTDWNTAYSDDVIAGLGSVVPELSPVVETAPLRQLVGPEWARGTWLRTRLTIRHGMAPVKNIGMKVWFEEDGREVRR